MAPLADVMAKAGRYNPKEDDHSERDELICDGLSVRKLTAEDADFIRSFPKLETLALNQTGLTTIEEFQPIETVQFLELTDNHLDTARIQRVPTQFPKLKSLSLGGNRINDLKAIIEIIRAIPSLEDVDLELNPITMSKGDAERVRHTLFNTLPQLKVVNGMDVHGNAVSDDEEDEEDDDENEEPVEEGGSKGGKSSSKSLLEQFYGKNYKEEDDDEDDEEDFNPDSCSEDSDDTSEEEEEEDADEGEGEGNDTSKAEGEEEEASAQQTTTKRKVEQSAPTSTTGQKKRRLSNE